MSYRIVIPARFGSERLPGKPLLDIQGKAMVVRVVEAAARSGAADVVVATDDERIVEAVVGAGHRALLTSVDHPSGSDRVMEVVARYGWDEKDVVVNLQGDEPLMPAAVLDQLAAALQRQPELASATLCEPLTRRADFENPDVVKVVRGVHGRALYFSRAPIPFDRDRDRGRQSPAAQNDHIPAGRRWWRHIGVYAYRVWALRRFVALPVGELEATEKLEQLRLLENGLELQVEEACERVPAGVDTAEDLERVRALAGKR